MILKLTHFTKHDTTFAAPEFLKNQELFAAFFTITKNLTTICLTNRIKNPSDLFFRSTQQKQCVNDENFTGNFCYNDHPAHFQLPFFEKGVPEKRNGQIRKYLNKS